MNGMTQLNDDLQKIGNSLDNINKVLFYISHPVSLAELLWKSLVTYSYPICMMVCLIGIILYLIGIKKGGKYAVGSLMAYIVIQMLNIASK